MTNVVLIEYGQYKIQPIFHSEFYNGCPSEWSFSSQFCNHWVRAEVKMHPDQSRTKSIATSYETLKNEHEHIKLNRGYHSQIYQVNDLKLHKNWEEKGHMLLKGKSTVMTDCYHDISPLNEAIWNLRINKA